ncbi:hypothetical protein, partial [Escherichia coli]|uniref:hypothetical protein n=1 Tax=Escherichia coli TaxID=562 RepID=UPI003CE46B9A
RIMHGIRFKLMLFKEIDRASRLGKQRLHGSPDIINVGLRLSRKEHSPPVQPKLWNVWRSNKRNCRRYSTGATYIVSH